MKYKAAMQDNGQIELPPEWLKELGVKGGDAVLFVEAEDGSLTLFPRRALGVAALNRISRDLKASGVSLEEFLEEGEKIRQEIYEEQFAHKVAGDA